MEGTRGLPSRSAILWLGGLLAVGLLILLGTMASQDADGPSESRSSKATGTMRESTAPTLSGSPPRDTTTQPAPEPAPKGATAAPAPAVTTWVLEFEVAGAARWWRATFIPRAEDGEYRFVSNAPDGPPSGRLEVQGRGQLEVYARGRVPWRSGTLEPPSSGVLRVTARLEEGLSITGTLLGADGATPVARGQVRVASALGPDGRPEKKLDGSWVHPDAHGRFRLTGLSPGPVEIFGFAYDRSMGDSVQRKVEAGAQRVVLQLRPMGVLRVRISDAATGKAPRTSSIQLSYPSASGQRATTHTSPGVDGAPRPPIELRLRSLQLGKPGTLRVHAKGYAFFTQEFEFPEEGGVQELPIRLQRGDGGMALMTVTLLVDNVAKPEVVHVMRYTGKHGVGGTETVSSGRLELRLAPGTTSVVIGPVGSDAFHVPVDVNLDAAATRPGAEIEREVRLVHGGKLRFSKRPPGTRVHLTDGTVSIDRWMPGPRAADPTLVLAPGRWSFRIEGRLQRWVGEAEIRAGHVTDATWSVERVGK